VLVPIPHALLVGDQAGAHGLALPLQIKLVGSLQAGRRSFIRRRNFLMSDAKMDEATLSY